MRASILLTSFFVASTTLAGCYAQAVSQDRFGGELVLQDQSTESMDDAKRVMTDHCGVGNWRIEGWDLVEQTPPSTAYEYHLYYSCLRPTSPLQ